MARQLTMTLPDEDLDDAYRAMAADTEREHDAFEWIEVAPDDALP